MPLKLDASRMLTNFSANVAALRKGLGHSQEDLARKLRVARTTISNWEKGVAYPSFADLLQLAIALDTTMDELVGARSKEQQAAPRKDLFDPTVEGHANIVLLDQPAVESLPAQVDVAMHLKGMRAFRLPEHPFTKGLFICLQHHGDAMAPTLRSGEWLIARHVAVEPSELVLGEVYIVATALGVVCRRVIEVHAPARGSTRVRLATDNPMYAPYDQPLASIVHLFQCRARLSYQFEHPFANVQADVRLLQAHGKAGKGDKR